MRRCRERSLRAPSRFSSSERSPAAEAPRANHIQGQNSDKVHPDTSSISTPLKETAMRPAALVFVAALAVPASVFAQDSALVIKADTVLDGKGGTLTNTSLVVQGGRI